MNPHWSIRTPRRVLAPAMALALLLFTSGAPAAEPLVLTLNDPYEPPYTTPERSGFIDIVATEAFRRAGLELRLTKLPSERALGLANTDIIDGDIARIAGLEKQYSNLVRVPERLSDVKFSAFAKDASIASNLTAIRTRSVGYIRGWKVYEQALAGADDVLTASDTEQLFRLLELGRIEVALHVHAMGLEHVRKHGFKDVRVLVPALYTPEMFIYLHTRHATHVPAIAAALSAMKQDGSYARAYENTLAKFERARTR